MNHARTFPTTRLRRLRLQPTLRALIRETTLSANDLILPLFIAENIPEKKHIDSMPGHYQLTLADLPQEVEEISDLGIRAVLLFGIPKYKDAIGSAGDADNGVIQRAIQIIKQSAPHLIVITDCCYCEYTDHGHCGILDTAHPHAIVDNDATLPRLVSQAISHAKAGADMIAPSGMIDGMVGAIRTGIDKAGYNTVPILSYAVKYSSALYGPFRDAAEGTPQFGDRKTYQMDPANAAEALHEAQLDVQEGADMLMVKPALFYLDIIYRIKQAFPGIPLAAYHVSGEYALIKAAGAKKWIDEQAVTLEALYAIKRAGADCIITYYAKEVAQWLLKNP